MLTPLWLQQVAGYTATETGFIVAWIRLFRRALLAIGGGAADQDRCADHRLRGHLVDGADVDPARALEYRRRLLGLALPHLLQGMGMPFFFVGLTALALSSVPAKDQTSAAGLMSFLRT